MQKFLLLIIIIIVIVLLPFYILNKYSNLVYAQPALAWLNGMTLGNINEDPRPDIVTLSTVPDFRAGQALYYYRIGYDISETNSSILHGVTQPIEIPFIVIP